MSPSNLVLVLAQALMAAILIWPVWSVELPAMVDYPAHVSSLYVQMHGAHDPALTRFYQTEWDFVPDLASQVLVPALAALVPFLVSVKLFLSLALVMWVAAPVAIHYALYKRASPAALAGGLFAYNAPLMWGFINFYFAVGLALLIFSAWIATESRRGRGIARTACFALAALALYFAHVLGELLLFLLILFFDVAPVTHEGHGSRAQRMSVVAMVFLPATVFFLFLRPSTPEAFHVVFHLIGSFPARLAASMQNRFDTAAYVPLVILGALVLAGWWTGRLTVHPRMIPPLTAFGVFCLLAPTTVGGAWGLHLRFPAVLCLAFLAAARVRIEPRHAVGLVAMLLAFALLNAVTREAVWRAQDRRVAEFRQAMQSLPPGSALFTALDKKALGRADTRPYRHLAEYAIMDRSAFVPLLFTTRGQHVVHTRPPYESIAAITSAQGHSARLDELPDFARGDISKDENLPYLARWPCHFDAVIVLHLGKPQTSAPPLLRLRRDYSFFSLYDVVRPPACG